MARQCGCTNCYCCDWYDCTIPSHISIYHRIWDSSCLPLLGCREGLLGLYRLWGRPHRTVCLKHIMYRSCARVCGYRSHFHHPTQSNIPLQGYLVLEDACNSRMLPSSSKSKLITSRHIKPCPAIFSFILHGPRENHTI